MPLSNSDAARLIADTVAAIGVPDAAVAREADRRQDDLTKPPGALGRLEALATRIAGMTGQPRPRLDRRLIVVAAGDHGVAARGVSAYPAEVTAQMVANFLDGGAAVNVLADHAGARVRIVDAGVAGETSDDARLLRLRLARGTGDMTRERAMTREVAALAVAEGIALVARERADAAGGADIIAAGEMGIGNTTSAAALIAAVTGRPPRAVTGRGTGIDDAHYERKVRLVEQALALHRPDPRDGLDLLSAVGGLEAGVLAGVTLGAAAARVPLVMDGVISGAAVLVAEAISPGVREFVIAAHRSPEPGHAAVLEHLRLEPLLDLGLRLGEGAGAALGMTLCVAACRLLDEMATFTEAGVSDSDEVVEPEGA